MNLRNLFCFTIILFASTATFAADDTMLQTLKTVHPRLILQENDIPRIQSLMKTDAKVKQMVNDLESFAKKILPGPTVEYKIVGPRLLTQSRNCLQRVSNLSLLYLLTKEEAYLDRVKKELFAAAAFPDWNPSHFLDTAEMTHAFAIGYDWLYPYWTEEEHALLRKSIMEKGIKPYFDGIKKNRFWYHSHHNWNQVCHGGIGIGALAIADVEPELSEKVIQVAVDSLPYALKSYAPDGGWNEGPGYWHYATRYTVYFLAALDTALGTDFGLSKTEGFDNTGQFRIDFQSPTGYSFNYADAGSAVRGTHEMYWLAKKFNKPEYAWFQRQDKRTHALDVIWYSAEGSNPDESGLPLANYYKSTDTVFARTSWTDPNAVFIGFKGGDNKANHSHLDLGSFVLDALGERWFHDLGGDNYNLPGYFGSKRWTYYRLNTHSHNTLVINGENQDPKAAAPITHFYHKQGLGMRAVADLSEAYSSTASRVQRGIGLDKASVVIQDEIDAPQYTNIEWGVLTKANIQLKGKRAILSQNGKFLLAQIVSPQDARFSTKSANQPKPQKQQPDVTQLAIRYNTNQHTTTITVVFTPYMDEEAIKQLLKAEATIVPLSEWPSN